VITIGYATSRFALTLLSAWSKCIQGATLPILGSPTALKHYGTCLEVSGRNSAHSKKNSTPLVSCTGPQVTRHDQTLQCHWHQCWIISNRTANEDDKFCSIVAYRPVSKRWLCKQRPFLGNG
jgi:hypothetical protein